MTNEMLVDILREAYDESFGEIMDKMPKPPDDATQGEKIYEYGFNWFCEGFDAGVKLSKQSREEEESK